MSVMILKPSQEVAGSGSAGREKAGGTPGDRARVGAVLTPLPLHAGLFLFSESRRFLAEGMGEREGS